jgi:hypothetical protein
MVYMFCWLLWCYIGMSERLGFRVGQSSLALEVPPFFINFEKRNFSSIMARRQSGDSGILVYIYITRKHHVKKLLVLKGIHPDLYIPQELHATRKEMSSEEIEGFIKSVKELEKSWVYQGEGIWLRRFGAFTLSMILIIGENRWTVRPAISKKGVRGYGVEIPVDTGLAEQFKKGLKDGELEEIHDHTDTQHFHLTVSELDRYIELAKKWDYYFSEKEKWKQTVSVSTL